MGRGRGESDMLNGMSKAGVIYKVCFSLRGGLFCLFLLFGLCTNAQRYQQLVKQGLEQMQKDSLQQAEATFREALEVDPLMKSNALLYQYIGNIQERRGEYQRALESYNQGLAISGTTISLLLNRASLYMHLDNTGRAMADYTEVLNLEPNQTEALFFRAYLYSQRRDYKLSRADYERLIKLEPLNEKARLGLAILNDKDRRPREAMEQMDARPCPCRFQSCH